MANYSEAANRQAIERIAAASPFLVGIERAGNVIPDLSPLDFLHAGPPLAGWHEVCGALRGAVVGTLLRNGSSRDAAAAEDMAAREVRLISAQDRFALGTYGGVITRDTPVLVVENRAAGTRSYAALNEGRGKALRYGSYEAETLKRLDWLEGEFAEILDVAVRRSGGIDLFAILEQALHMGDDGHSRQKAASALFANIVAPFIAETALGKESAPARCVSWRRTTFFSCRSPWRRQKAPCSRLKEQRTPRWLPRLPSTVLRAASALPG